METLKSHKTLRAPPLAAPSTRSANTLHLESQKHSCRNAHCAAAAVESHAGEEGKGEGVSLPHHSIHRSQGSPSTKPRRGLLACVLPGRGQWDEQCTQPQAWDPPAMGHLSSGNSYLIAGR